MHNTRAQFFSPPPPFPPLSLSSSPCMDGWASCPYMDSEEEGLYWVYALYSVSTCWWDNLYCYCSVQGFPSTYKIPVFCFIEIQSVIELSYFLVAPVLGLLMSRNRIRLYDSTSTVSSRVDSFEYSMKLVTNSSLRLWAPELTVWVQYEAAWSHIWRPNLDYWPSTLKILRLITIFKITSTIFCLAGTKSWIRIRSRISIARSRQRKGVLRFTF